MLTKNLKDNESNKFRESSDGVVVAVIQEGAYETNDYDKVGTNTYYTGKSNGTNWLISKMVDGSGADFSVRYATIKNNPAYLTYTDAWNNRLTLTYSLA